MPDDLRWYLFLLHADFALLPRTTVSWNRVSRLLRSIITSTVSQQILF